MIHSDWHIHSENSYDASCPITTIGDNAFAYCRALQTVHMSDSVATIGEGAFLNCEALTSLTIGNGLTTIGESAFKYCEALTSLALPDSVTDISCYAFFECYSLTDVYFTGTEEQWFAAMSSLEYYKDSLFNFYSEDEPTTSGNYWHYVDGVPTKW